MTVSPNTYAITCVTRQRQEDLLKRVAQERLASLAERANGAQGRWQVWQALTVLSPALPQAAHKAAEAVR